MAAVSMASMAVSKDALPSQPRTLYALILASGATLQTEEMTVNVGSLTLPYDNED